jgi:hypothetical protein
MLYPQAARNTLHAKYSEPLGFLETCTLLTIGYWQSRFAE